MTSPIDIAICQWFEPGGVEAAIRICEFLAEIGVEVRIGRFDQKTFVPGMAILGGAIVVDPDCQAYPGDLLHEAGHLAIAEPWRRTSLCDVGTDPGEEMAAIAWSVAAAHACNISLRVLFHPAGYKGGSHSLIENFSEGRTFGVPLLAWWGMTMERGDKDDIVFPALARWLR